MPHLLIGEFEPAQIAVIDVQRHFDATRPAGGAQFDTGITRYIQQDQPGLEAGSPTIADRQIFALIKAGAQI